jgi:hypothetical protein
LRLVFMAAAALVWCNTKRRRVRRFSIALPAALPSAADAQMHEFRTEHLFGWQMCISGATDALISLNKMTIQ